MPEYGWLASARANSPSSWRTTLRPRHVSPSERGRSGTALAVPDIALAADLPEDADVYPTHGFGSFCAASQSGGVSSTIGRERRVNPVLTLDEQLYVNELLAGLDAYPAYYAHVAPANAAGRPLPGDVRHHCRDGVGLAPQPQNSGELLGR